MAALKDKGLTAELIEQAGGIYPPGQYDVFDQFDEPFRSRLVNLAAQLGLPRRAVATFKPWLLGMAMTAALMLRYDYDPADTFDYALYEQAMDESKATDHLFDPDEALRRYSGMPIEAQKSMAIQTVREAFTFEGDVPPLIAAWKAGDEGYITRHWESSFAGHSAVRRALDTAPKIELTRRMRGASGRTRGTRCMCSRCSTWPVMTACSNCSGRTAGGWKELSDRSSCG